MKKISKNNIKCSECGSANTVIYNEFLCISDILIIIGSMGMFISAIIPLFWICLPIMFILGTVGIIGSVLGLFLKRYRLVCNDCKSKFKLTKEEYKEAKNK